MPLFVILYISFSERYTFLLDRTIIGSGVVAFGIIAYLSSVTSNQPLVANFFAYFDPKERINSRDILFLICCPAHQRKDVKQELEKAGLTSGEATSRRYMIPGRDMAFVFVSGGITFASSEDMAGGCYLRLGQILTKRKMAQRSFVQRNVLVTVASSLQDVPEISWEEVSLFSFLLVDVSPIISNYAPKRAKRRTEGKGDRKGSFAHGCLVRSQLSLYDRESNLDHLHQPANFVLWQV